MVSCAEIECEGNIEDRDAEGNLTSPPTCDADDRPATLEYVVVTILRPSCGNAQCHSSFKNEFDYRFDTIEHAAESMTAKLDGTELVVPGDPDASVLYNVITRQTQEIGGDILPRMPYDQPLPIPDIALIRRWIAEGADGLTVIP